MGSVGIRRAIELEAGTIVGTANIGSKGVGARMGSVGIRRVKELEAGTIVGTANIGSKGVGARMGSLEIRRAIELEAGTIVGVVNGLLGGGSTFFCNSGGDASNGIVARIGREKQGVHTGVDGTPVLRNSRASFPSTTVHVVAFAARNQMVSSFHCK
jgi:hypothetical protein